MSNSMSTQHTPGPWHVNDAKGSRYIETGRDHAIARIIKDCKSSEFDANARLIAAAPDLLFQLLAASNYIDALGGDSKSHRAAIAKAQA